MFTDKKTFGDKIRGFFSLANENLSKKDKGRNDFVFSRKEYSFPVDDQIQIKMGLGQFGTPAYIPWIGFMGSGQKPQKGIYPVILNYLKQGKILIVYGVSAVYQPDLEWGSIKNKDNIVPIKIRDYFKDSKLENHDYDDCFVYSAYTSNLDDDEISNIYDDLSVLIDLYKKVLDGSNLSRTQIMALNANSTFSVTHIIDIIRETGLVFSNNLIKRLAYSLMAKPFVILSGLAGSGKTQLALTFAKCLSDNIDEQICTVAVGADWTNREPLLGYPNAIKDKEYVLPENGALQLLMHAKTNPNKPYFLILDEMNLSVVERYFADFLSAMESGENIKLWDGNEEEEDEKKFVPAAIGLPKNVFIIGTINVDETTYMFSPKVLDRANVIEFKVSSEEMQSYLTKKKDIHLETAYSACADMAIDFVIKAQTQVIADDSSKQMDILMSFFKELKKVNAEFGYRTVNEITRYLHFAGEELGDNGAIDTAILQKLLPKLHGSRKKLVPILTAMWKLCQQEGQALPIETVLEADGWRKPFLYPESAEKIQRMYNAVVDNGFTSFAEA